MTFLYNYKNTIEISVYRPYDAKNPFLAQIVVNKELHKGGDRSCIHVELDISDSKMRYEAGKVVLNSQLIELKLMWPWRPGK